MTVLQLRNASLRQRPTSAWLIVGDEPRAWLDELCGWGVPLGDVQLHPLPVGADRRILGVLATLTSGRTPDVSPRVIPYGAIAGRLFLPIDATIAPPVTDPELAQLLSSEAHYVWHPAAGLVRFDGDDRVRVAQLFEPLSRRESLWDAARPGVAVARRLSAIEPDQLPTAAQILEQGRDDIATEPPKLDRLPPSPDEPRGLRRLFSSRPEGDAPKPSLGQRMLGAIARTALRFASQAPQTSSSPTWVNSLEGWANNVLRRMAAANPFARMREIQRLLHLLETDPIQGLRFAIPFGAEAHRGLGSAGNQLVERNVDFNLGQMGGGGGAADPWNIPNDFRARLQLKYRELAIQEANFGRHRRAAYIYAELLGDLPAAAAVLAAGRHFREAAVLYRTRLNQPYMAARCLEQGGLLTEAAALFEELRHFETAGDIHARLEDRDEARRCYELHKNHLLNANDFLSASRLTEAKLEDADAAREMLHLGWSRRSSQMQECLEKWFQHCGRHGLHERSSKELAEFRREADYSSATLAYPLATVLAKTAADYPDGTVRALAEGAVRVVVGRRLPESNVAEARGLVSALARLAPHDRLLQRDTERYVRDAQKAHDARLAAEAAAAKAAPKPAPGKKPLIPTRPLRIKLLRTIKLSPHVEWQTAAAAKTTFYAAGYRGDMLVVARGFWDDDKLEPQTANWRPIQARGAPIFLAPDPEDSQPLLVHVPNEPPLGDRSFPPVDRHPLPLPAGAPSFVSPGTWCIARDAQGSCWAIQREWRTPDWLLTSFNRDGVPTQSVPIDLPAVELEADPDEGFLLHIGDRCRYVAFGRHFRWFRPGENRDWTLLPDSVRSMCGSSTHTRERVAMTFDTGGLICWGPDDGYRLQPFAEELKSPRACFTPAGWLAAASAETLVVYRVGLQRVDELCRMDFVSGDGVFAVLPTAHFGQFAVFSNSTSGGVVRIWQITGG